MKILLLVFVANIYIFASTASAIILPKNFTAYFTQKITNPQKKVIHYQGSVSFSEKKLLKWVYLKPTKKEVCTNGNNLLIVDHDLEQVSHYLINKGFDFAEILRKAKLHSKDIYVGQYQGKKYTIKVDEKGQLQSVAYFDDLENKVQISFQEIKYGEKKLSVEIMQCKYPKAYDTIRG